MDSPAYDRRVQAPEPTPSRPPRRRRGWTGYVGWGLLLAGVAVLAYLAWQLWVTNWLSQREHRATVDRLEQAWERGRDDVAAEDTTAGAVLRIARFGDDFAVPVLEGDSDEVLAAGVGHLPGTGEPGARGNYVLAGHRITHGEPFRDFPELEPGDEVVVETGDKVYTYVLDTAPDLSVRFSESWVLDDVPANPEAGGPQPDQRAGQRLLTLVTCAELFHTDERLVVFGHLESVTPRG